MQLSKTWRSSRLSLFGFAFVGAFVAIDGMSAPMKETQKFSALVDRYLDEFPRLSPIAATSMGDHRFDHELDDISPAGRAVRSHFEREILNELKSLPAAKLSRDDQVDRALLQKRLEAAQWSHDSLREWSWNPLQYTRTAGNSIYSLMAREFAPLPQRLKAVTARLEKLPLLYEQGRSSLAPAKVPSVHAETAIQQNRGILNIITNMVAPHLEALPAGDRTRLSAAIETAAVAVERHQTWLEKELLPKAKGNWRLGAELFDQKLSQTLQSPMSRDEIRDRGRQQLRELHGRMYGIAKEIYRRRHPYTRFPEEPSDAFRRSIIRACLELAAQDRPTADGVVAAANRSVELTAEFIRRKDLITLPDEPMEIIVMPEFRRGVSLAYCDSPGPLEKGLKTFYAVAPPPASWNAGQVESHLREYNHRSLHNLTIHEAFPGHFVQLAHANKNPGRLRSILFSGTFVEGWAVYTEWMMCEEGFLPDDPLMRLVVLKWYLRDVTNALLDQAVNVDGISRDAAMRMMVEDAFQEEREAAGKWRRAQLTSAQLSTYFVGYLEQIDLRAEAERRWGDKFDLKTYHDRVLSHGSIPASYVRSLMFGTELP